MKIGIIYFTNTGNTEKIARAIRDALSDHEIDLLSVNEADNTPLNKYDVLFLGSGVYGSIASNALVKFIISSVSALPKKIALFCTHESLQFYQRPFKRLEKVVQKQGCSIIGEFDCLGENLGMKMEDRMKIIESLPPEKKEDAKKSLDISKGRPNEEDLNNAKRFALEIIKKV
ncbi:MAG: flavodoxin family protein [Promethearchaeota archaeon]